MSSLTGRALFIDAPLNNRLKTELRERGRAAFCASEEELHRRVYDDVLLAAVADRFEDAVIVTSDDHMPQEWADVIARLGSTIAVVAPWRGRLAALNESEDHWERDTVHRWAHIMQRQPRSTVRRYGPSTHGLWTAPS
jgi:hypothetical protein